MRILYLSQYFPPEIGATQNRAYEMASNLVELGHHVTMITELPNHPSGIFHPEYKGKVFHRSQLDGIDVIRVWVKTSPVKNFTNRILFYLSYMFISIFTGLALTRGKFDIIYATSPPLFVGGAALILSFLKRVPLIFEVRDLWPESAIKLGELSNKHAVRLATSLEESCYKRAKIIIVVTKGIMDRLCSRGIEKQKIILIPNGANISLFQFQEATRQRIREQLEITDKFVVVYAGIFGIAQGLETIIDTAEIIQERDDIQFLLIGDGPTKDVISKQIKQKDLSNITLHSAVPRDIIPAFLSSADVALIPLRKINLFKGALPSKIFDAWACERPILLCVDGEARVVMEEAAGGLFVPPEEPFMLANAVLKLKNEPELCTEMGKNGRKFTENFYSRKALAMELLLWN
jgi:glycosyltransferase involved in cell wall biosynthesis